MDEKVARLLAKHPSTIRVSTQRKILPFVVCLLRGFGKDFVVLIYSRAPSWASQFTIINDKVVLSVSRPSTRGWTDCLQGPLS